MEGEPLKNYKLYKLFHAALEKHNIRLMYRIIRKLEKGQADMNELYFHY